MGQPTALELVNGPLKLGGERIIDRIHYHEIINKDGGRLALIAGSTAIVAKLRAVIIKNCINHEIQT